MERRELVDRDERHFERRCESASPKFGLLHVAGGIALLGLTALVIVSLPDIRRYIKISRM